MDNAMQTYPDNPRDEAAVESPSAGEGRNRRTNIESPVDTDAAEDVERHTPEAHTPRPHPPVEEPEDNPEEHVPETEPDGDPDADSDQRRPPPRPGKAPR
jgi:hypothetical protein